ncbi:TetR/AcrR family transcriptional regulator [Staphylospora marina]|uniref:TetR/AcrR family transcriptional regulator n=1 Tax=Staphylospora marina TaxID=2490858 RepID=UPI000F5BF527|nr:TetR/AcrR family transcriptional regulator [Staphylospora marina]
MSKHQLRSQQTMRKIKDAGFKLFVEKGYASTSIDEIMKVAGYTKGAFYAHFDSKEDFFLEVLDERIEWQFERMKSIFEREAADVFHDFVEIGKEVIEDGKRELYTPMMLEFMVNTKRIPEVREKVAGLFENWRAFLADYFQQLKETGSLNSDLAPRLMASAVLALFNGYFMQHHVDPELDPHEMVPVIVRLMESSRNRS